MNGLDEINPDDVFLTEIINAIPSGVFVSDLDHNILMINKAGAELAARTPGDCFDRKCYDVFNTIVCKTDYCAVKMAISTDATHHGICVMHINGKEIPIEYASSPLKNRQGKTIGCVEHFIDITDRLAKQRTITDQHEQVLRLLKEKSAKNVELDRANTELFQLTQDLEALAQERTIAEMALQIADRIRNPATAIGGLTRKLLQELPDSTKQNKKFQAIMREVEKLEERVNSFEQLATEQGKLFTHEDVRQIMSEVVNTWSSALHKKEIQLTIKKPAKPIPVIANRRTLKVAFLHILRNAVESSPSGAEISIEITTKEGRPTISITDHGKGIPAEVKDKLFENVVTTKPKGTGMGLMLVKQIIMEHQGDIEIESTEGKGTKVILCFPLRLEENCCSKPTCVCHSKHPAVHLK